MNFPSGLRDKVWFAVQGKDVDEIKKRIPFHGLSKVLWFGPEEKMTFMEIYSRERNSVCRHFRDCKIFEKDPDDAKSKWTRIVLPDHYLIIRGDEIEEKFEVFHFGSVLRSTPKGTIVEVEPYYYWEVIEYFHETCVIKERNMKTKKWKRIKPTKKQLREWDENAEECGCPEEDICHNCKTWEENKELYGPIRRVQPPAEINLSETFMHAAGCA